MKACESHAAVNDLPPSCWTNMQGGGAGAVLFAWSQSWTRSLN